MGQEKIHYSNRLARKFRADDYLTIGEVRAVLAENRNAPISTDVTSYTMARFKVRRLEINACVHLYLYEDVKEITVPLVRGRQAAPSPTPGAARQCAFRARRKAEQLIALATKEEE